MIQMDTFEGVIATVQKFKFTFFSIAALTLSVTLLAGCPGDNSSNSITGGPVDPNETAATVNGKIIKMEEVERAVKQQAKGEESKLSPLELAGARLQVLQGLVEQEVMFQKAEKENTVPTDEEVTIEINKQKVDSRMSAEEFDKQMKQAGLDEKSFRENMKKGLAIKKLIDKVTGRIEIPKDREIEDFFKGNPELFIRKRGVRLAAIVVDPTNSGEGDTTTNDAEASQKVKEIFTKVSQPGSDFASLAREYSEDPSKFQGGDLGYLSEDDLKKNYPQLAAGFMNPEFTVGRITNMVPINGKGYIFKLQERIEKEEILTLESQGVRQQIQDLLVNNRKQLLAASYQAIAMNEAKIENFLAKKVVANPNELSGARPAGVATPANVNTAPVSNANAMNANSPGNSNTGNKPATNANANKPANANK